ncbi:MAG: nitrite reductase/ring-hydroxylating ferredoxin subunit [Patiriisocius sp.]|jgi:nitrite reductase/ring-hydroxylating ferredoxin subunit
MRKFIIFFILFCTIPSCKDNNNNSNIPDVFVDISLSLSLPSYNGLMLPGNSINITGGSNGIIVYAISNEDFVAFDRHCTYDINGFHRVIVSSPGSTVAEDTDGCGSRFSIITGDVLQNPASIPLKAYNTEYFPGTNVLRIYN